MELDIKDWLSQCYGKSVMSGKRAGVSANILEQNAKPVRIHSLLCLLLEWIVDKSIPAAEDILLAAGTVCL